MLSRKSISILFLFVLLAYNCTKLKETTGGNLGQSQIAANNSSAALLLEGVYASLEFNFSSYLSIFALSDLTTDEAIAPTRGNNWDDNGQWRVLHEQKYDPNNPVVLGCFNALGGTVYAATDMLQYNPTLQQQAEARFLRAWAMYWILDLFDQVPYRDPGESVIPPARVMKGMDALNYIIGEINAVEANLPEGPASEANRYAAQVLLMKCYLNKAVYANRANPSFDPADMNKVISLADSIIKSGQFSFSKNYYDNFSPVNAMISRENIFTQAGSADGNYLVYFAWLVPFSYPQGGFNGFSTLPGFYSKFAPGDQRMGIVYAYPNCPPNPGNHVNVGFLIGQQYDLNSGDPLSDGPLPVIFTPDVQNIEPGPNLEMPGIRPIKYAPDYQNFYGPLPGNNFVYFRFPDVLLMKAEAILRGGSPTNVGGYGNSAMTIVNAIRTDSSRGASPMASVTLDSLLDERGRELWWENWRRQDMIRFQTYLLPFDDKDYQSDPHYLVFPIPYQQLDVNPNLVQNPGY